MPGVNEKRPKILINGKEIGGVGSWSFSIPDSPNFITRCSRCVMPSTWSGISFDEKGVCNICHESEKKKQIDWGQRQECFKKILEEYRNKAKNSGNKYDCLVGFSGGKDTAYTLWAMKRKYNMRPLAVTWDHGFKLSPEGEYNMMEVPKILDCDHLRFTIGNGLRNGMCKKASEVAGDFCYHCHLGIGAFPARVSKMMDIPLQIWGEPTAEYGTSGAYKMEDLEEQDYEHYQKIFQAGVTPEMVLPDGYEKRDLQPMQWSGIEGYVWNPRALYLGNYELWDQRKNVRIITEELGWKHLVMEDSYVDWDKVDCPYETIRNYQKYLRRGFGKATFQASKDIRDGLISRFQGMAYIAMLEGKKPSNLEDFYRETGLTDIEGITSRKI